MVMPSAASLFDYAAEMATTTATATGADTSQVIAAQSAMQISEDLTISRYLLLSCAALVVLCGLLTLPRFLARLGAPAPGHILPIGCDLRRGWLLRKGQGSDRSMLPLSPPAHVSPAIAHVPFASWLHLAPFARLPQPLRGRLTVAPLYLIMAYVALVLIGIIWRSDLNPTTKTSGYGYDFARTGYVATSQIPVVVALGVRGNIVGLCVGKGYERLRVYHKLVGRVIFLAATIHAVAFFRKWAAAGVLSTYSAKPFVVCAIVAWVGIIVIAVTSLPWCRRYAYKTFAVSHFVGILMLLIGLAFHVDAAIPYCITAAVIYALSTIASLCKTRLAFTEMTALPGSATTIVRVPMLTTGWRAGQHVRLRVPALGIRSMFESHPFTIASAPDSEAGLVLMCKATGDWTRALYDLAARSSDQREDPQIGMTVVLEGPFGGLGNTLASSFSSVVLVAGGSGISQALGIAHDLVQRASTGAVRARSIDVIWLVRNEAAARELMPTLVDMVNSAQWAESAASETLKRGAFRATPPTALRVAVHVTRCPSSSPLTLLPPTSTSEKFTPTTPMGTTTSHVLSFIHASSGRPDVKQSVHGIIDETLARVGCDMVQPQGVLVTACGPAALVDDVRDAVRRVPAWKTRAVGGVELEEEYFGF